LVFHSSEAALNQARGGGGIAFALLHKVTTDIKAGRIAAVELPGPPFHGTWTIYGNPPHQQTPAARELLRFVSTPRAVQATLAGSAAQLSRFRPSVHVTLWAS
jgi:DNA-binding transcriptional LysR family regulator